MTREDKDLILKDICARLPYGVICYDEVQKENGIFKTFEYEGFGRIHNGRGLRFIENIKPYLFPLSSMTEEQMFDFATVQGENCNGSYPTLSECSAIINWGYKHHFDVNNLIEKGLAIDATGLNIY